MKKFASAAAKDTRQVASLFAGKSSGITQNEVIMKRCLFLLGFVVAAVCSSLSAQTLLSILQESTGKTVELHLQAGDKIGGKVEQVNENVVHLSHLTGAEFFDAFVNVNDVSAVVIRTGGKPSSD
jgi:hypothetical protein